MITMEVNCDYDSDVGLLGGAIPLGKAALASAQVVRKLDTLK